jgi:hypothetical protein
LRHWKSGRTRWRCTGDAMLADIGVFAQAAPRSFELAALGDTLRSDIPGSVRNFAVTETAPDTDEAVLADT